MFKVENKNTIVSDAGFSVEVLGRTGVRYQESDLSLVVDGEILAGPSGFLIYSDTMKPDTGYEQIKLNPLQKSAIINKIKTAFAFRGFDIEIY